MKNPLFILLLQSCNFNDTYRAMRIALWAAWTPSSRRNKTSEKSSLSRHACPSALPMSCDWCMNFYSRSWAWQKPQLEQWTQRWMVVWRSTETQISCGLRETRLSERRILVFSHKVLWKSFNGFKSNLKIWLTFKHYYTLSRRTSPTKKIFIT